MTPNIAKQIECWTKIELKNWHHLLNCTVGTETVVENNRKWDHSASRNFFLARKLWAAQILPTSWQPRGCGQAKHSKTIHPLPVKGDHWRPRLRSEFFGNSHCTKHKFASQNHLKSSLITINYPFYCPHVAPAASHPEALRSWPILLLRWAESCLLPPRRRAAFSIALVGIRWIVNCATPLLPSVGRMRSWAII
jgi:hypothetical protein